jgi:hypothetical protein
LRFDAAPGIGLRAAMTRGTASSRILLLALSWLAVFPVPADTVEGMPGWDIADRWQAEVSNRLDASARWLDAFFVDPLYEAEQNDSRLRVRLESTIERGEAVDFGATTSLRLQLPGTERQWSLFFNDVTDDVGVDDALLRATDRSDTTLGLRYFLVNDLVDSVSISASLKRREGSYGLFLQPRLRKLLRFEPWHVRATQLVGFHSKSRFETETRLDLERLVDSDKFLRATAAVEWAERLPGSATGLGLTLRQVLDKDSVLSYQLYNGWSSRSGETLHDAAVGLVYRRRAWRPWLFVELAPRLAANEADDYRLVPGITLYAEVYFGRADLGL